MVVIIALWMVGVEAVSPALLPSPEPCLGRDMLRFKDAKDDQDAVEVRFTTANQHIIKAAEYAHDIYGSPCIVTAGHDGKHGKGSKHYEYRALDFRTWHLNGQPNPCRTLDDCSETCKAILAGLKARLGKDYDVIFEPDTFNDTGQQTKVQHIHAEYDPKTS